MTNGRLRRRCERAVAALDLPTPLDPEALCAHIGVRLGRRVRLIPIPLPSRGRSGYWLATEKADFILTDSRAAGPHQVHIVMHELAHMILGHGGSVAAAAEQPPGSDRIAVHRLNRTAYDDAEEREAETMASVLDQRVGLDPVAVTCALAGAPEDTLNGRTADGAKGSAARAWITQLRQYHRLRPLWTELVAQFPEHVLETPPRSRLVDLIQLRGLTFRLLRRYIEIRDARRSLTPFERDADFVGGIAANGQTTGAATAFLLEAARIRAALDRAAAGPVDGVDAYVGDTVGGANLHADIEWLGKVAQAFRRLPSTTIVRGRPGRPLAQGNDIVHTEGDDRGVTKVRLAPSFAGDIPHPPRQRLRLRGARRRRGRCNARRWLTWLAPAIRIRAPARHPGDESAR